MIKVAICGGALLFIVLLWGLAYLEHKKNHSEFMATLGEFND